MVSNKARKGNPFEYDTAYSLQQIYTVERTNDNTKGIDIIAKNNKEIFYIECKNRQKLSWTAINKIFQKTLKTMISLTKKEAEDKRKKTALVIFKSNFQPTLVFNGNIITTFENYFNHSWSKKPKGYKLWRKNGNNIENIN